LKAKAECSTNPNAQESPLERVDSGSRSSRAVMKKAQAPRVFRPDARTRDRDSDVAMRKGRAGSSRAAKKAISGHDASPRARMMIVATMAIAGKIVAAGMAAGARNAAVAATAVGMASRAKSVAATVVAVKNAAVAAMAVVMANPAKSVAVAAMAAGMANLVKNAAVDLSGVIVPAMDVRNARAEGEVLIARLVLKIVHGAKRLPIAPLAPSREAWETLARRAQ